MRKFFYGLGVITALVLVAGAIGIFVLSRNGAALDTASRAYVDDSVVKIVANWDAQEFWKRASPRFRAASKYDDIAALFDGARSALGPMVEYRGSQGEAIMSVVNSQTKVTANYIAQGSFQKGNAALRINMVKQGDTWMIEGFNRRGGPNAKAGRAEKLKTRA
jgi:hypothetical protein